MNGSYLNVMQNKANVNANKKDGVNTPNGSRLAICLIRTFLNNNDKQSFSKQINDIQNVEKALKRSYNLLKAYRDILGV